MTYSWCVRVCMRAYSHTNIYMCVCVCVCVYVCMRERERERWFVGEFVLTNASVNT